MSFTYWFYFESNYGDGYVTVKRHVDISRGDADMKLEELVAIEQAERKLSANIGRDFAIDERKTVIY